MTPNVRPMTIGQSVRRTIRLLLGAVTLTGAIGALSAPAMGAEVIPAKPFALRPEGLPEPRMISSAELVRDPEMRNAFEASIRQVLAKQYPDMADVLELTPDQHARFIDRLTRNQLAQLALAPPDGLSNAEGKRLAAAEREALTREQEASLTAMLGATTHGKWKQYQQDVAARSEALSVGADRKSKSAVSGGQLP